MSLIPRLTLIGLYKYNSSLFSNLIFPDNIDKDVFIDSLLLEYGECPLIYPDMDFMLLAIGAWSRKWYHNFERIADAITAEYNPIYNYDRHEEWTETDDLMRSETDAITGNETNARMGNSGEDTEYTRNLDTNYTGDSTTENQVSAYNESTYQPKDKEIYDFNNDTDTDESYDSSTTRNASENHTMNRAENRTTNRTENVTNGKTGHAYGNIGVTESTAMLQHELDLRKTENLYHILCELFYKEFCIYVF